jgi:hypothetical protein
MKLAVGFLLSGWVLFSLCACRQIKPPTAEDHQKFLLGIKKDITNTLVSRRADPDDLRDNQLNDKALLLDLDFDGDGINEKLTTFLSHANGKIGFPWTIEKWTGQDWVTIGGAEFYDNFYYLGYISEIQQWGIVAYQRSSASSGTVYAWVNIHGKVGEIVLGEVEGLTTENGSSSPLYDKYTRRETLCPIRALVIDEG